jgi:hypothetical protein
VRGFAAMARQIAPRMAHVGAVQLGVVFRLHEN